MVLSALAGARLPSRSTHYRINCPFCILFAGKDDKRWSLSVNARSGWYNCFRCETKGKLTNWTPIPIEDIKIDSEIKPIEIPEEWFCLDENCLSARRALRYVLNRGINIGTIREAKIGTCLEGHLENRIVVPILDKTNKYWLGYVARDFTNKQALRYRYPKGMQRGKMLYNHAALFVECNEPIIAVEGVFDALTYWPDAVAFLGKPSKQQKQSLLETKRPICIVLDGDAHEEGWSLAQWLKFQTTNDISCVKLPPTKDPNSVNRDWLLQQVRESLR